MSTVLLVSASGAFHAAPDSWHDELIAAGWRDALNGAWSAPDGGLYRGPYDAWVELQRRRRHDVASS